MSASAPLVDSLPAVRAMIKADATLMAQFTGGAVPPAMQSQVRVYSEQLPPNVIQLAPAGDTSVPNVLPPTVVARGSGGTHEGQQGYMWQPRIDLRVYAPSASQARTLWIAVYNSLQRRPGRYEGVYLETLRATLPQGGDDGFVLAVGLVVFNAIAG